MLGPGAGLLGSEAGGDEVEQTGGAAGHVHGRAQLGGDPVGDAAELPGGSGVGGVEHDGTARVAPGRHAGLERDLADERSADLGGQRGAAARAEQRVARAMLAGERRHVLDDTDDAWLRRRFEDMGVIQFEDWIDTSSGYEALDDGAGDRDRSAAAAVA